MLPAARTTLLAALDAGWANPQRLYAEGRTARALLDQAREVFVQGLGVRPAEVSFLPSGPAALRTGLEGLRHAGRRRGARMAATAVEHSAILVTGRYHAAAAQDPSLFAEVPVDRLGRVDLSALEQAVVVPGTVLAAVQSANGEIGTRQPLERAHALCRTHDVPLLVDAMASLGRDAPPRHFDVLAGDDNSLLQGRQVNPSQPVHRHLGKQRRVLRRRGVISAGDQDRGVLDGGSCHTRAAAPAGVP